MDSTFNNLHLIMLSFVLFFTCVFLSNLSMRCLKMFIWFSLIAFHMLLCVVNLHVLSKHLKYIFFLVSHLYLFRTAFIYEAVYFLCMTIYVNRLPMFLYHPVICCVRKHLLFGAFITLIFCSSHISFDFISFPYVSQFP